MIMAYFWDEHSILWATKNLKNSIFGGFYGAREYIKNIIKQFLCVLLHD